MAPTRPLHKKQKRGGVGGAVPPDIVPGRRRRAFPLARGAKGPLSKLQLPRPLSKRQAEAISKFLSWDPFSRTYLGNEILKINVNVRDLGEWDRLIRLL